MLIPYYFQLDAINSLFDFTASNHGKHPVIVIPTAGGKSLVMAYIIKHMMEYPDTRVLIVTHRSKLIQQNYQELIDNFAGEMFLDVGIYSAGLKCRDTENRIIFAGIQSVHDKAWHLGWRDLILVDECHRIPHNKVGTYRHFFAEYERMNSNVVIAGLSATPFRMKGGLLWQGKDRLFDSMCYEAKIKELINPNDPKNRDKKQFLCTPISKSAVNKVDLTGVHTVGGEYKKNEMEKAFFKDDLVGKAVQEIKELTIDRKKCIVFAAGVDHCEDVHKKMELLGMTSTYIHSKQSNEINEKNIQDFKNGKYKFLINIDILTEGFNERRIDCVILLRSTKSPALYVQMVGRGFRLHPDKADFLVLDFGRNVELHGPIDKIEIKKKKDGTDEVTTAPQKTCPGCGIDVHAAFRECPECGFIFVMEQDKHEEKASDASILSEIKRPKTINVVNVGYSKHEKPGKTPSLKVSYYYDIYNSYNEWVCIEHAGFAKRKADKWIKERTSEEMEINTIESAINNSRFFKEPSKIIVDENDKFPKIIGYIFGEQQKNDRQEQSSPVEFEKEETQDEILGRLLF